MQQEPPDQTAPHPQGGAKAREQKERKQQQLRQPEAPDQTAPHLWGGAKAGEARAAQQQQLQTGQA
eukprot:3867331-Prorocentrum_lima.AAC.1